MPGGFTNRWVCKIKEGLDLDLGCIKELDGHFWEEQGEKFPLRRLIKLDPEILTQDIGAIVTGSFYFNWEQYMKDYEIKEDGTISETYQVIRRTNTVPFWISFNQRLVLFPNSKQYTKEGAKTLSKLFFGVEDGFIPVKFDIRAIEEAANRGEFAMWTYSFVGRQGSVRKGTHYGDDIDPQDPMYQETSTAPKKFIGIKLTIFDREVKVKITRDGSITFYGAFDEPQLQPELFRAIGSLMKFSIES